MVVLLVAVFMAVPIAARRPMFPAMVFKMSGSAVMSWRRRSCMSIVAVVPAASDEIHRNAACSVLSAVTFPMTAMFIRNR